jgi:hypothetical protein
MNLVSVLRSSKQLMEVTGIEPVTSCLQISAAASQSFGISNLRLGRLPLFGLSGQVKTGHAWSVEKRP